MEYFNTSQSSEHHTFHPQIFDFISLFSVNVAGLAVAQIVQFSLKDIPPGAFFFVKLHVSHLYVQPKQGIAKQDSL